MNTAAASDTTQTPPVSAPGAANTAAVAVRDLCVSIGDADIVRRVSMTVAPGDWLSIIGPNGAGKSTVLRAIGGALPFSGTIEVEGRNVDGMSRNALAKVVAWVPQHPTLPSGMRVVDYVLLGRTPHRSFLGADTAEDREVVSEVIAELDLAPLRERHVHTLSGGERQRVLIARALAQHTPIVLLDEPTTALDLGHQQDVLTLLDELRTTNDLTIISTMHDLSLAGQYATDLVLLADGEIQRKGDAATVLVPEIVRQHFGATVNVIVDDDGTVIVVPKRGPNPRGRAAARHRDEERS